MEDSGSVEVIARLMTEKLGTGRAVFAVVLAGAISSAYGGVSLFVSQFLSSCQWHRPIQDRRHTTTHLMPRQSPSAP